MTKDEILALQVGGELDALVAEKVMGWKEQVDFDYVDGLIARYVPNTMDVANFQPSTDISAAWEVVEKMHDKDFAMQIMNLTDGNYFVAFSGFIYNEVTVSTATEAICKAALLAVMDELPKAIGTTEDAQAKPEAVETGLGGEQNNE